jgi:hypothetical protein
MFDGGAVYAYRGPNIVKKTAIEVLCAAGLALAVCQPAAAQARVWEDRAMVGVSFGVQVSSADVSSSSTFPIYEEEGTVNSQSTFGSDVLFDVMAGVRVWRNFGIAGAYHVYNATGDSTVDGTVPHPTSFLEPARPFSQSVADLDREELAGHLMFGWMVPVSDRLDIFVYAGPSFFRIKQDVVDSVTVPPEQPPYTSVTVTPNTTTLQKSVTGYNVGADATYFLTDSDRMRLGIGVLLRYTGASADIGPGGSTSTDLGGFHFAFGARVRF